MTNWPEWLKDEARRARKDESAKLRSMMAWAAILLTAADAPVEERKQLMEMADEVLSLRARPRIVATAGVGNQEVPDGYRLARIREIERRFDDLCERNSIVPAESVPAAMQADVRRVLADVKRARAPLEVAVEDLNNAMEQALGSAIGATGTDTIAGLEEWQRLARECRRVMTMMHRITFLGPDVADVRSESE